MTYTFILLIMVGLCAAVALYTIGLTAHRKLLAANKEIARLNAEVKRQASRANYYGKEALKLALEERDRLESVSRRNRNAALCGVEKRRERKAGMTAQLQAENERRDAERVAG